MQGRRIRDASQLAVGGGSSSAPCCLPPVPGLVGLLCHPILCQQHPLECKQDPETDAVFGRDPYLLEALFALLQSNDEVDLVSGSPQSQVPRGRGLMPSPFIHGMATKMTWGTNSISLGMTACCGCAVSPAASY